MSRLDDSFRSLRSNLRLNLAGADRHGHGAHRTGPAKRLALEWCEKA